MLLEKEIRAQAQVKTLDNSMHTINVTPAY